MLQQIEEYLPPPDDETLHPVLLPSKINADAALVQDILRPYREDVVYFLFRLVQNAEEAEELALETLARLHESAAHINNPASAIVTRLFRVAFELARRSRGAQIPPAAGRPMMLALHRMPLAKRAAVVLHKYHQCNWTEIANVLNCTEFTARGLVLSAYEKLRDFQESRER